VTTGIRERRAVSSPVDDGGRAGRAARQAIVRLRASHGPLMFVQSAGCCGGSAPMCFRAGEFITGAGDVLLGEVEGCSFYIDARQYTACI
jgi:uncharacterized protein